MPDVRRNNYDLSHFSFMAGKIGMLMSQGQFHVIAGDTWNIRMQGVFRLSPLRRNLTMDAIVDNFAFFTPYRHIYSNWVDFIKEGIDEDETLSSVDLSTTEHHCLGVGNVQGTIPLWPLAAYNHIWNFYFRHPTDANEVAQNATMSGGEEQFGRYCCFPKNFWTTGVNPEVTTADYEIDVSGGDLNILELAQQKGRLAAERRREFFAQRYHDVMRHSFGTGVGIDTEERPALIMHNRQTLSGYDVDGTSDTALGTYSGKAAAICGLNVPKKKFNEHGVLSIMSLVRFPVVHEHERHYLMSKSNPTYKEFAGDPQILEREPPHDLLTSEVFEDGDSTSMGLIPYANWHRTQPSIVHKSYDALNGFAFMETTPTSLDLSHYYSASSYDSVFQTQQLGQWQSQVRMDIQTARVVPGPLKSIFAGTR